MVKTVVTMICDVCKKESSWDNGYWNGKPDNYRVNLPDVDFKDICFECAEILSQYMTVQIIKCSLK